MSDTGNNTDIWENVRVVGAELGIKDTLFRKWKSKERGCVPPKWHYSLTQKASEMGVDLTAEDLNSLQRNTIQ